MTYRPRGRALVSPLSLVALLAGCAPDAETAAGNRGAIAPAADRATQNARPPAATPPASGPVNAATPALAVEGEGLRLFNRDTGSARAIAFGTAGPATLAALAFRGEPGRARLEECGAGPLDQAIWPDGLTLFFQDGKFVGWALDGRGNAGTATPAVATAASIGPGSTRQQLLEAYSAKVFESTLGTEFAAGDLSGLLDGPGTTARITNMWAGASCNFR